MVRNVMTLPTIAIAISLLSHSCGSSLFKAADQSDTATEASIALEKQQPTKAIRLIMDILGQSYRRVYDEVDADTTAGSTKLATAMETLIAAGQIKNVPNLISILASAKAQLHGIDPFDIALRIAESATTQSDSAASDAADASSTAASAGNQVTRLFPILPEASEENIHGVDVAMAVLQSLGELKTTADEYKEALFLTASIALVTKTLDSDGDGEISALESITLSDTAANALLNQITSAAAAAASSGENGQDLDSATSTAQIQALKAQIDAEEGATQEEKLRNFIAKSGQSGA